MSWNDGYVVDVPYTEHAYSEMTPTWLSLASVLNLQPPLDTTGPFTYVELGCGRGLTACTVAATNPSASVWGFDFNPAHVERARRVATEAGLSNCSFAEASFEELAHDDALGPAEADVIALHGVFSWISPANRALVVEIIRRRLVPGGVVYVSYNVLTGWAAMLPVQQAMQLQVVTDGRQSDVAIRSALASIHQLVEDGARSFPLAPREQTMLDALSGYDPGYVAHEYLGGSFAPMMFADVAAELSTAKCNFVGSTALIDSLLNFRVPSALQDVVRAAPNIAIRETICDLAIQTMFRGDVFRRGLATVSGPDHRQQMDELQFISTGRPFNETLEVATGAGTLRLDDQIGDRLLERLGEGPLTGRELRTLLPVGERSDADLRSTVAIAVATGYALPVSHGWERNGSIGSTWRMNRMLVQAARRGSFSESLVSPVSGGVVRVAPAVALAVSEHWDGVPLQEDLLVNAVIERAHVQQLPLSMDGVVLTDEDGVRDAVTDAVRTVIGLLSGSYRTLGINASQVPRTGTKRRRR